MARRPRPGVTPTLAAALRDVALWEDSVNQPEGATIDYTLEYVWIGPGGKRQEVIKEQLTEGFTDGWPMPGEYEITPLDSNGEPLIEPFRALQLDKDALARSSRPEDGPAALMLAMSEDARITIRNQRANIDAAEKRERAAREELNKALDQVAKLTRESAQLKITADRAMSDMELAVARQQEAEEAYTGLENEILEFRPHVQIAVDHAMHKLTSIFGLAADNVADNVSANTNTSEDSVPEGTDPRPPGCENPVQTLDELYEAVIYNWQLCRYLVDNNVITWDLVRRLVWLRKKIDLGPTPVWDDDPNEAPAADQANAEGVNETEEDSEEPNEQTEDDTGEAAAE